MDTTTTLLAVACTCLATAGCTHYISSYKAMDLRLGFPGEPMVESELTLSDSPKVVLTSEGCKRGGGLRAPPVILELVSPTGVVVSLQEQPILVKSGTTFSPYQIKTVRGVVGGDRVELRFMMECLTLDDAELRLGRLLIAGRPTEVRPVRYKFSEHQVTELNRLPDKWYR